MYDTFVDPMELSSVVQDPQNASRVAAMAARIREIRPGWPNDLN